MGYRTFRNSLLSFHFCANIKLFHKIKFIQKIKSLYEKERRRKNNRYLQRKSALCKEVEKEKETEIKRERTQRDTEVINILQRIIAQS